MSNSSVNVPTQVVDASPKPYGFKNAIINGNFGIWQRGTSFNANGMTADRWANGVGTGGAMTVSRQAFAVGQTEVPSDSAYFLRHAQTTLATGNPYMFQTIEGVRTFSGQTITISAYMKADAARSVWVTVGQYFGTGGSPSATVQDVLALQGLTTSWKRYTWTYQVPSIPGKTIGTDNNDYLYVYFYMPVGVTFTIDYANVQVELGSIATEFERRHPQQELALCQRYYYQSTTGAGAAYGDGIWFSGYATSGGNFMGRANFPVPMRAVPVVATTNQNASGFGTTDVEYLRTATTLAYYRTATSTGVLSWSSSYTASAEL